MTTQAKCASCGAAAARVLPVIVQISVSRASPIHQVGRAAPMMLAANMQVPLCDDCDPLDSRASMMPPQALPDAPRVKAATAEDMGRLVRP